MVIQNTLRPAKLTPILSLKRALAQYWTDLLENLEKSVWAKIGKINKIAIGMLFLPNSV